VSSSIFSFLYFSTSPLHRETTNKKDMALGTDQVQENRVSQLLVRFGISSRLGIVTPVNRLRSNSKQN